MHRYYMEGNEIAYCLIQFNLNLRRSGDVLLPRQHLPAGFADMLRQPRLHVPKDLKNKGHTRMPFSGKVIT